MENNDDSQLTVIGGSIIAVEPPMATTYRFKNGESFVLPEGVTDTDSLAKLCFDLMKENERLSRELSRSESERKKYYDEKMELGGKLNRIQTAFATDTGAHLKTGNLDKLAKRNNITYSEITGRTGIVLMSVPRDLTTAGLHANINDALRQIGGNRYLGVLVVPEGMELRELSEESIESLKEMIEEYGKKRTKR
jgi:hypothetical protein